MIEILLAAVLFAQAPTEGAASFAKPTDSNALAESIKRKLPEAEACYEEFRKRFPKQGGTFQITLTIEGTGKVSKAEVVSGPFQDDRFLKCLKTTIEKWTLAEQGGSIATTLTLPFTFTPPP